SPLPLGCPLWLYALCGVRGRPVRAKGCRSGGAAVRSLLLLLTLILAPFAARGQEEPSTRPPRDFNDVNRYVQERCVKIYGAGGLRQLEAYQSGFLVSAEGHIATASSLVLDRDQATVLLSDGRKFQADVVGS